MEHQTKEAANLVGESSRMSMGLSLELTIASETKTPPYNFARSFERVRRTLLYFSTLSRRALILWSLVSWPEKGKLPIVWCASTIPKCENEGKEVCNNIIGEGM